MPDTEGLSKATQFQIDSLLIVGSNGVSVDVRQLMRELNLYEDLFTNTMYGNLLLSDTQNLINILPIVGSEYLVVSLSKPTTPWKITKTLRIYKITDRRRNGAYVEDYILHLCSEETILNESIKISKAYKGLPVSDIIQDITKNYLQIAPSKFPPASITNTMGNHNIVVPFWTPFYTINWLVRLARTAQHPGCSFAFFEDRDGFRFTSIEALSQQTPVQSINFMPMNFHGEHNTQESDMQMRQESAESYEIVEGLDVLRSISTGMYAGKLVTINPIEQRINVHSLDAATLYNNTKHPNPFSCLTLAPDRTRHTLSEHHDANFRVAADNLSVERWMLQRDAYLSGIHAFRIRVAIGGNMLLRVGQMVQLNLPAAMAATKDGKELDRLFTGKYLITAIRHKVDRTKYVCILELSKDSLTAELPAPLLSSPTLNTIRQA
jgi:hypothetical protein